MGPEPSGECVPRSVLAKPQYLGCLAAESLARIPRAPHAPRLDRSSREHTASYAVPPHFTLLGARPPNPYLSRACGGFRFPHSASRAARPFLKLSTIRALSLREFAADSTEHCPPTEFPITQKFATRNRYRFFARARKTRKRSRTSPRSRSISHRLTRAVTWYHAPSTSCRGRLMHSLRPLLPRLLHSVTVPRGEVELCPFC